MSHAKYVPHCKWRNAIAVVMAAVTLGSWIPFVTRADMASDVDDDDEASSIPPPIFEGHPFPTWPIAKVPGNTQHDTAPTPPKAAKPEHKHTPHPVHESKGEHKVKPAPVPHLNSSILVAFLRAQLGKPYVWGGNGPGAYDCSGLTVAAYARVGIHLPRTSQDQSTRGRWVSLSDLKIGDLLFWGSYGNAYHVAIYIGNGKYIGAQNPATGVVERSLRDWEPNFARRVL